ncbi:MAG: hypothetical protein DI637_01415 [Citromicrobium sp.]|nr:MAG: hypothetical protein DI637_01415 [Citromicrobium sp.]
MSQRRILIIHRYFWPENISQTPFQLKDIAWLHLGRGDHVTVVTGTSDDFTAEWSAEFGGKVQFRHFVADNDRGQSAFRRMINAFRLGKLALVEIVRNRFDLMYVLSYPPLFATIMIFFNRLFGAADQTIFYVQDMFSYRISNKAAKTIYERLTGWTVRASTTTITLSEAMHGQLRDFSPRHADKGRVTVIPNTFPPSELPEYSADTPTADVIYAGAHGKAQNLTHFVKALALVPVAKRPTAVFFGEGSEKSTLMSLAEELELTNWLQFHDGISRDEIAKEIRMARFGLVGAVPELMKYAFPSKMATYLSLGTSVLMMCQTDGPDWQWLLESGNGLPLDPSDINVAASQLGEIRNAKIAAKRVIVKNAQKDFGLPSYLNRMSSEIEYLQSLR